MQTFLVKFIGTTHATVIAAKTMKEAKAIFAKQEGVSVSSYIKATRQLSGIERAELAAKRRRAKDEAALDDFNYVGSRHHY